MRSWRRWVLWGVLVTAVVAALAYAFRPKTVAVDMAQITRGPLVVTVDDEGKTRVKQAYIVSAPVAGRARRITLEVGDTVQANVTKIADIEPIDPAFLDIRSRAQAEAAVRTAEAAKVLAAAELKAAEAELVFARTELGRARQLFLRAAGSKRTLDQANRAFKTREAAVETFKAKLRMREYDLVRARLQLVPPGDRARQQLGACACIAVRSPVSGSVLRIFHKSAGVVTPGQQLLEVGDPRTLEIVVDLLSSDAVRTRPGQRVIIEGWGGKTPLTGRLSRVEPLGKTKVSALGIEEQRVDVVIQITDPAQRWATLGHGYRVETRIVLWETDSALKVPLSALFRVGDQWAVFAVVDGKAKQRIVEIGQRTALAAEILKGLSEKDQVIVHPSDQVVEAVRVVQRRSD